ncbi:MAG: hypothetical protein LRY72_00950 [Saccharospirillaceae bacterium]|nr:hypothetical protein [Saccharospirillaceae bacterium]
MRVITVQLPFKQMAEMTELANVEQLKMCITDALADGRIRAIGKTKPVRQV